MFKGIKSFFLSNYYKISEINKRYAKPGIKMTPTVRISLFALRIYLFVLVGLIAYKFIITLLHKG
jgi:hypothetical protein